MRKDPRFMVMAELAIAADALNRARELLDQTTTLAPAPAFARGDRGAPAPPDPCPPAQEAPNSGALTLRPKPAAKRLGVGITSLYELLAADELESFVRGRARFITVASIDRYLERQVSRPGAGAVVNHMTSAHVGLQKYVAARRARRAGAVK
jgi:hypothetical protein